ncbi:NAD(P)-binding domain-containing protein [Variovorax ginsengisoli]|uniref:NAD(P)-binding domain-containing protein n=1 Tax=Variovorax ginsengisoli TaxID=363844 RepID=A0ABT8S4A0_9BURK|nr:NAD(P)-binding domain-containing protein [Variovorax ginsengisoli]MDN8614475.1 NAD(P)-binding domain-containing protein [Variovorax ginsengisoli]MDO1533645.1 NAD(P)-binding domain-containing protein [Variovorax ginsengisoli]
MQATPLLDLAIVGGGVAGVIHLHYARQAGLDTLLLEKQDGVGGLWRQLPAWQDIQISPADWTVGDLPLGGPKQPCILANIEAWVERFELADRIRFDSPVSRARYTDTCWELDTPRGTVRARHLVAATGGHNTPAIPDAIRRDSEWRELHSSALRDPTELTGREVIVVGGGASAFDLLDLCLEHKARRIAWVYRGLRWFTPTGKPKAIAGSVRPYAKMQASGMTVTQQNETIGADLLSRYEKFGIQSIRPQRLLDVRQDQLIPGRARMLASFAELERYPGSVEKIEGRHVTLSDGTRLAGDVLLWGTGYQTDLSYFEEPRIARVRTVAELASRCACIFRSLDAPDLYFPGVGLDGIGAAPWAFMLMARSVMSHIRGTAQLDMEPVDGRLNHFDIVRYLAERDRGTYAGERGWDFYRELALGTPDDQPYPLL